MAGVVSRAGCHISVGDCLRHASSAESIPQLTTHITTMLARSLLARSLPARSLRPARKLHAGARLRFATPTGSPTAEALMNNPKARDMFAKVGKHPAVVEAIVELSEILKRHGIGKHVVQLPCRSRLTSSSDAHSGERPSMVQIARVLMDKDFREASMKLKDKMEEAGVEMKEFAVSRLGAQAACAC